MVLRGGNDGRSWMPLLHAIDIHWCCPKKEGFQGVTFCVDGKGGLCRYRWVGGMVVTAGYNVITSGIIVLI